MSESLLEMESFVNGAIYLGPFSLTLCSSVLFALPRALL